jgi:predicted RNA binding protein YcfA (HicA-like mRNA interferase family)
VSFQVARSAAILEHQGFELVRQRGDHMVLQRHVGAWTITVPVPDHRELRVGTLLSIIRQSRVARELFEEW